MRTYEGAEAIFLEMTRLHDHLEMTGRALCRGLNLAVQVDRPRRQGSQVPKTASIPAKRRGQLSRLRILSSALELVDQDRLEALTMRRLAEALSDKVEAPRPDRAWKKPFDRSPPHCHRLGGGRAGGGGGDAHRPPISGRGLLCVRPDRAPRPRIRGDLEISPRYQPAPSLTSATGARAEAGQALELALWPRTGWGAAPALGTEPPAAASR